MTRALDVPALVARYEAGASLGECARAAHRSWYPVRRALAEAGVSLRPPGHQRGVPNPHHGSPRVAASAARCRRDRTWRGPQSPHEHVFARLWTVMPAGADAGRVLDLLRREPDWVVAAADLARAAHSLREVGS